MLDTVELWPRSYPRQNMSELGIEKPTRETDEEDQIAHFMQELLAGLPGGTATLGVRHDRSGTVFYLKPSNKKSAEFGIHYDGCVDVFFGSGNTFELDGNVDELLELVRPLALAVISGRCEQRFGFLGVRGKILLDGGKVYRCTDYFHPRLYPKTVRYEPYYNESGKP